MRNPLMLPVLAVVDPELALGLPPAITASTGLDALTQLIEAYVSVRANVRKVVSTLGARNRTHAVALALKAGLID